MECEHLIQFAWDFVFQWIFLPDPVTRSKLVFPPATKVDYRAACFCHRELIDIGYVCSVCLSSEIKILTLSMHYFRHMKFLI